ncbi:hypothetical protein [Seonamhaeicola sp. S2-3]|uniref:hypothetical protein n=1 Tax=Seonamhaeicola sp. S2-3 TaxID=1936081 RepID=UPI003529D6BB
MKHQFLYPKHINSLTKLEAVLSHAIDTYNNQRPQLNLNENTLLKFLITLLSILAPTLINLKLKDSS